MSSTQNALLLDETSAAEMIHDAYLKGHDVARKAGMLLAESRVIHDRITAHAVSRPSAIALSRYNQRITYAQLELSANRFAHYLMMQNIGYGSRIAVVLDRSVSAIVVMLGIMKTGAAYVVVDPATPSEMQQTIREDANCVLTVYCDETRSSVESELSVEERFNIDDYDWSIWPVENPARFNGSDWGSGNHVLLSDAVAYICYEHDSDESAGIMVEHQQLVRLLTHSNKWFSFSILDRWACCHTLGTDLSAWEVWGALMTGAQAVIVTEEVRTCNEAFYHLMERRAITVLNQAPKEFIQVIEQDKQSQQRLNQLRVVLLTSSSMNFDDLRPWVSRYGFSQPRLAKMYGQTETTLFASFLRITEANYEALAANKVKQALGEPIPDMRFVVLDEEQQPVPKGQVGELYIAGAGLVRGYFAQDSLTEERFIELPKLVVGKATRLNQRFYRTGDKVKESEEGGFYFVNQSA